jgi:hypothetical protein
MFVPGKPIRPLETRQTSITHQNRVKKDVREKYGNKVKVEFDSIYAGEGEFTILVDSSYSRQIEDIKGFVRQSMERHGATKIRIG